MLAAGQRIAHLEIHEKLGAGGRGVVYKARDLNLDRLVALKVLAPGRADEEAMQSRLLREARAASALNHPNIVCARAGISWRFRRSCSARYWNSWTVIWGR